MKKSVLLLLILAGTLCVATPARAQFWKKIFKKEEKKPAKKNNPSRNTARKEEPKAKKRQEPEYPADPLRRESYRIDVLLPLNLNTLVQNGKAAYRKMPDYALPAINFYEGITLAAQTLRSRNVKLDIYIHDITDPAENIKQLTTGHKMDSTNLILGYLQSNDIPEVAAYAKKKKVNLLSVFSPADAGIKDNPYFLLIQPTLSTHLRQLISFADKKYRKAPKYIFHSGTTSGEKDAYAQLRDALIDEKDLSIVDCSVFNPEADTLAQLFDSSRVNVVFVSILDIGRTEQLLNTFAALPGNYRLEIFGMPSWKSLRGLTQSSDYMTESIYYTTPFFFDPTTGPGRYINTEYGNQFGGSPSEMVYRGYESLYWMANLLDRHGTVFNRSIDDVSAAPFTRYEIKPSWNKENDFLYLENNKLYIMHYQNGGYVVEQE